MKEGERTREIEEKHTYVVYMYSLCVSGKKMPVINGQNIISSHLKTHELMVSSSSCTVVHVVKVRGKGRGREREMERERWREGERE